MSLFPILLSWMACESGGIICVTTWKVISWKTIKPVVDLVFCSPFWHWAVLNILSLISVVHFCLCKKATVVLPSNLRCILSFRILLWQVLQEGVLWWCNLNAVTASCCCRRQFCSPSLLSCKVRTPFSKLILIRTEGKLILSNSLLLVWLPELSSLVQGKRVW